VSQPKIAKSTRNPKLSYGENQKFLSHLGLTVPGRDRHQDRIAVRAMASMLALARKNRSDSSRMLLLNS